jgi:hypothetical protein
MNEKEMKHLENQLHSWKPRRPSAKIKRRLYPSHSAREAAALSLRWLAPAAACLILALTVASRDPGLSASSARREAMMGLISSNLNFTNILPKSDSPGRNGVLPASFEWTNLSGITSSISPFSPARMN